MTNSSPFARRSAAPPTVPRGDVLGEYDSYPEAQKVVDRLAKAEFPVKGIAIVGSDLTTVERVTGRLSYGRAALSGAASGAWLGLFFGMLLFLFSPAPELSFILAAAFIGSGFGMIFGIVTYAINRRRRDFSSTHQVLASSYQIIIDPSQTARARQALAGGSTWPPPLAEQAAPTSSVPENPAPTASVPERPAPASTGDSSEGSAAPGDTSEDSPTPAEPSDDASAKR